MTFLCNADGRYRGGDRAGVRENGREADRDRDAPRSRAEANGRKDAEVRRRTLSSRMFATILYSRITHALAEGFMS